MLSLLGWELCGIQGWYHAHYTPRHGFIAEGLAKALKAADGSQLAKSSLAWPLQLLQGNRVGKLGSKVAQMTKRRKIPPATPLLIKGVWRGSYDLSCPALPSRKEMDFMY